MARKKQARLNDANNPLSPTENVLAGFEQVSKSTISQSSTFDKLATQQVDQLTTQESDFFCSPISHPQNPSQSPDLRKATFKIDSQILDSLESYHLQLQLNLGKRNAPFKEIIVELALKNILNEAQHHPEQLLELLQQQQQLRA